MRAEQLLQPLARRLLVVDDKSANHWALTDEYTVDVVLILPAIPGTRRTASSTVAQTVGGAAIPDAVDQLRQPIFSEFLFGVVLGFADAVSVGHQQGARRQS